MILGIESSCDECSASVVEFDAKTDQVLVRSVATFSQILIHQPFGGVVPEVASRNHLETVNAMINEAMSASGVSYAEIEAIAVTNRPGLIGALLVGVSAAKALAYALKKPLVAVHHLEGHAASLFLRDHASAAAVHAMSYPLLLAIVSGGHTNLYCIQEPPSEWPEDVLKKSLVARSRDDAAGEAFDKTAKLLGFPYPGGRWIDETARNGNAKAFAFPRAMPQKTILDFSFSGLKTAVALQVAALKEKGLLEKNLPDLCASIQEAILDALVSKMLLALEQYQCRSVAVVGGVAANSRLRSLLTEGLGAHAQAMGMDGIPLLFPQSNYCTDNAAMIAAAGGFRFRQGRFLDPIALLTLNAIANPN